MAKKNIAATENDINESTGNDMNIKDVNQPVIDYNREQILQGNSDVGKIFEHAKTLDPALRDWTVQKYNAAVHRKVRKALADEGQVEATSRPASGTTTTTHRAPRGGRKYLDNSTFRDLLVDFARGRMNGKGQVDVFEMYSRLDPRAAKFRDVLNGFAEQVDGAEDKSDVFGLLSTLDARADEMAKLFA